MMTTAETLAPSVLSRAESISPLQAISRSKLRRVLGAVALLSWFGIVFFDGLNAGPLFRTEGLRALVANEMMRGGNWLVPYCYHEPLLTKPPGAYLAIVLASLPNGAVEDWTSRLPSAIAATICVLLFHWHFSRRLGRQAGWVAGVILAMSLLWLEKVPTAEIDALQVMWVTASLVFLFRALDAECADSSWLSRHFWWSSALLCVAGGFLTKWTAPAFFYLTALPLLWTRGRLRLLWSSGHLLAATLALVVCLAWVAVVVAHTGPQMLRETLAREGLMRLLPSEHHRPYPWLEVAVHPWKLWAAALPWSLVALLACRRKFGQCLEEPGRRTWLEMHCWVWPSLVFWTIIPEHATRHSFPLLPGIAGLAALVWIAWLQGSLRWPFARFAPRHALATALGVWLVLKLVFVHAVLPERYRERDPQGKGEQLARVVPAGHTLYLFRVDDDSLEGVMFYYSKARAEANAVPVQRLASPADLPSSSEPLYCIVDERDWEGAQPSWIAWENEGRAQAVHRFCDERNVAVLVVRLEDASAKRR